MNLDLARKYYNDEEIAAYLVQQNPKVKDALEAGYSLDEIADFLSKKGSILNPIQAGESMPALHGRAAQEMYKKEEDAKAVQEVPEWGRQNPTLYGLYGAGKALVDPNSYDYKTVIEGVTSGLGAVAGTPLGVYGVTAGGYLGNVAGKQINRLIDSYATGDHPTMGEAIKGLVGDSYVSAVEEAAGLGLGKGIDKAVGKTISWLGKKTLAANKLPNDALEEVAAKISKDTGISIDDAKDVIKNTDLKVKVQDGDISYKLKDVIKNTDDFFSKQAADVTADQLAATKDFNIKLTKGQATKSLLQQKWEVEALNGVYGDKAQKIMQDFADLQNKQIRSAAEYIQRQLGGKDVDTYTAANMIRDRAKELFEEMSKQVDEAYGKIDFTKAEVDKKFLEDLHNKVMSLHDTGYITIDKELTPNTTWALNQIQDIAGKFLNAQSIPLRDIEILRRRINSAFDGKIAQADKRALMSMKEQLDATLNDYIDNNLFSGDLHVIDALKQARQKRADMGKIFDFGAKDAGRKLFAEIINNDITPEHVANYVFGRGQLIGNSKDSVEALRFLKQTFGENSAEWRAIKAAGFTRVLEAAQSGEYLKAVKLAKQIQQNLLHNRTVMSELYNKDELEILGKFANAVSATVPDERAFNPSRTAYSLASIVRNYTTSLINNPATRWFADAISNAYNKEKAIKSTNFNIQANKFDTNIKGGLRVPLLTSLAGFGVGGTYGLTQGDTLEERIRNAGYYGLLGAGAGYGLAKLLKGEIAPVGLSIGIVNPFPVKKATVATGLSVVKNKTNEPVWKAAKNGSIYAAHRLVNKFVKEDSVIAQEIKNIAKTYPDAIIVPVVGLESIEGDTNKIPIALARKLSKLSGLNKSDSIVKAIGGGHTDKTARDRLLSQTLFRGDIKGRRFVLVDDQITSGSTLNELRHFIETQGGEVVGVFGLTKVYDSDILKISSEQIRSLEERYGREGLEKILRQSDIAGTIDGLTRGQADYLLRFSTLDGLRDRIFTARPKDVIQDIGHVGKQADARLKLNPSDIFHPKDWESFDPEQAKQYLKQQRNKLFTR